MAKKRTIEVPDTMEFRAALIFHRLDSNLYEASLRMVAECPGLPVTDEAEAHRKIKELRRDLSKQFATLWQREHGGPDHS